ncbi:TPA: DNA primase, partial [Staphylococcus aureus]|nr:DNA primase [Staphylococcus aureus]
KLIAIKPGSRINVSRLNEVIRDEIKVSSQVINDLVQANFNVQSRLNNGYKYWVDLGWKETDKKDDMISFDENENVTDDEFLYEDDLNLGWEDFDDE